MSEADYDAHFRAVYGNRARTLFPRGSPAHRNTIATRPRGPYRSKRCWRHATRRPDRARKMRSPEMARPRRRPSRDCRDHTRRRSQGTLLEATKSWTRCDTDHEHATSTILAAPSMSGDSLDVARAAGTNPTPARASISSATDILPRLLLPISTGHVPARWSRSGGSCRSASRTNNRHRAPTEAASPAEPVRHAPRIDDAGSQDSSISPRSRDIPVGRQRQPQTAETA